MGFVVVSLCYVQKFIEKLLYTLSYFGWGCYCCREIESKAGAGKPQTKAKQIHCVASSRRVLGAT